MLYLVEDLKHSHLLSAD